LKVHTSSVTSTAAVRAAFILYSLFSQMLWAEVGTMLCREYRLQSGILRSTLSLWNVSR
jgi:hypothetical protein